MGQVNTGGSPELAEAAALLAAADASDRANERDGDIATEVSGEGHAGNPSSSQLRKDSATAYDSAERRDAFASELEDAGVEATVVKSRLVADRDQATPATAAVASKPGGQTKPRGRKKSPSLERERGGLSR